MSDDNIREILIEVSIALGHAANELERFVLKNQLEPYQSALVKLESIITGMALEHKPAKAWLKLSDVQWMNIVNHEHAYESYDKEDAVHMAVKMAEKKLEENNFLTVLEHKPEVSQEQRIKNAILYGTSPPEMYKDSYHIKLEAENEALRQRVAELEAMVDQAQSYWDDILTKGESLKAENVRLQSECEQLRINCLRQEGRHVDDFGKFLKDKAK